MIIHDTNNLPLNLSKTRLSEPPRRGRRRTYVLLKDLVRGWGAVPLYLLGSNPRKGAWMTTYFNLKNLRGETGELHVGCRNILPATAKLLLHDAKAAARAAESKRKKR